MTLARLLNQALALELGVTVHVQGRRRVTLKPGPAAAAIEHIVGAVVHQPGTQGLRLARQLTHRGRIDQTGQLRLALGLVHGRVRGGVDNDLRGQTAHGLHQLLRPGEVPASVGAVPVERHHLAQRRQAALQLPAHLAALAQEQDFHALAPYWVCTQSR